MVEVNNRTRTKIDNKKIVEIIEFVLACFKRKNKDISVAIVGDIVMKRINFEYRNKNKPTDVLSFVDSGNFLGEIILDYAQIKRQSLRKDIDIKKEFYFILVHGVLHLLGFDDKTLKEADEMNIITRNILNSFFKKNIYA